MDESRKRELVQKFFESQMFAVVSSIWQGTPQSAVVAFTQLEDFSLVFGTKNSTRKYRNIVSNPNVSLVVGWDESVTIQLEGTAEIIAGAEKTSCQKEHVQKHAGSERYANMPEQRYVKITPHWIRYTDISQDPEFSFELNIQKGIDQSGNPVRQSANSNVGSTKKRPHETH